MRRIVQNVKFVGLFGDGPPGDWSGIGGVRVPGDSREQSLRKTGDQRKDYGHARPAGKNMQDSAEGCMCDQERMYEPVVYTKLCASGHRTSQSSRDCTRDADVSRV